MSWPISKIREDFPILSRQVRGVPLVYLDTAATAQKPQAVITTMRHFYEAENSNVHRGVHALSERATQVYESTRVKVKNWINAGSKNEIVLTHGTTHAINTIAQSYGRAHFKADDEVILSEMEHHANIVPWQFLRDQIGIKIRVIPMNDSGELDLESYERLFNKKTKFVSITHASNAVGTINPVKKMIEIAHSHDIPVLVDGAQSVVHGHVDVQDLDCDFFVFSAHKLYGPTGVGILYGKKALLEAMPPFMGGGDMIKSVTFEKTIYNDVPYKFEAGTPPIEGVIGFGAALDYLSLLDLNEMAKYEHQLLDYALERMKLLKGIRIIGQAKERVPLISFAMEDAHPHDIATIVDGYGIALRAGHHCAMPVMTHFNVPATTRVSFGMYNTVEEIDKFVDAIEVVKKLFA